MQTAPQMPFFPPLARHFLTDEELDSTIEVYLVAVYGKYTCRGENRKEVIERDFDDVKVEVPAGFNKGHVKLAINRHVRRELKGIRVRIWHIDDRQKPEKAAHARRVRDFMSDKGMRDNDRAKREYMREMEKRKSQADALAAGQIPSFLDTTNYGSDGLPPVSPKQYIV